MIIKNIVLIQCPWLTIFNPPNIGLAYIASVLRENGYKVDIIDLNIEMYYEIDIADKRILEYTHPSILIELEKKSFEKYLSIFDKYLKYIIDLEPDVVGFSVYETNDLISLYFARKLKEIKKSLFVIFGGPNCYPLFSAKRYIQDESVDVVIYGEGEKVIIDTLNLLSRPVELASLHGVLTKENFIIDDLDTGNNPEDLNRLPFPAIDLFPLNKYINPAIPISFNRGCVFKCEYCEMSKMKPGFRSRNPQNIIQEIQYYIKEFPNKKNFFVCDATITANFKQLNELCDLIIKLKLDIFFEGYATPHAYMDREFFSKMAKAGFNKLVFGVESGSDKILEKFGKKLNISFIENVIRNAHEVGIDIGVNILIGLPGETEEDFNHTLDFLARNRKYINRIGINRFGRMPYSYIYFYPDEFNFVKEEITLERIGRLKRFIDEFQFSYTIKSDP